MTIHCTAGTVKTNLVGNLPGYGTVWYHPTGIANILSLTKICAAGYHVTYTSNNGNKFVVRKSDGLFTLLNKSPQDLSYLDTRAAQKDESLLVPTVADNHFKYTNRDYSRAELARKVQKLIGRPSSQQCLNILRGNLLPNCPLTPNDITAAEDIFGPDIGSLKGKHIWLTPDAVHPNMPEMPASI
jgi:hypothetical protein